MGAQGLYLGYHRLVAGEKAEDRPCAQTITLSGLRQHGAGAQHPAGESTRVEGGLGQARAPCVTHDTRLTGRGGDSGAGDFAVPDVGGCDRRLSMVSRTGRQVRHSSAVAAGNVGVERGRARGDHVEVVASRASPPQDVVDFVAHLEASG
jgi:hypothetical protein